MIIMIVVIILFLFTFFLLLFITLGLRLRLLQHCSCRARIANPSGPSSVPRLSAEGAGEEEVLVSAFEGLRMGGDLGFRASGLGFRV